MQVCLHTFEYGWCFTTLTLTHPINSWVKLYHLQRTNLDGSSDLIFNFSEPAYCINSFVRLRSNRDGVYNFRVKCSNMVEEWGYNCIHNDFRVCQTTKMSNFFRFIQPPYRRSNSMYKMTHFSCAKIPYVSIHVPFILVSVWMLVNTQVVKKDSTTNVFIKCKCKCVLSPWIVPYGWLKWWRFLCTP